MEQNLKSEEREVVKLVQYFKKRAQVLINENKLDEEYRQMLETCDKLIEQIYVHAKSRENVLAEREQLQNMIKDNAKCPKCNSNEMLKVIGFDTNAQGWKSNKYKCRKCNIAFVWNTPNNPWDLIPYVEKFIKETEEKIASLEATDPTLEPTLQKLQEMKANLASLKPVADASDLDMKDLEERETQMTDIVHKFKKHLMIEKIKMED